MKEPKPTYTNPELEMISKEIEELAKERRALETEIAQKEADIRIKNGEVRSLQVGINLFMVISRVVLAMSKTKYFMNFHLLAIYFLKINVAQKSSDILKMLSRDPSLGQEGYIDITL